MQIFLATLFFNNCMSVFLKKENFGSAACNVSRHSRFIVCDARFYLLSLLFFHSNKTLISLLRFVCKIFYGCISLFSSVFCHSLSHSSLKKSPRWSWSRGSIINFWGRKIYSQMGRSNCIDRFRFSSMKSKITCCTSRKKSDSSALIHIGYSFKKFT